MNPLFEERFFHMELDVVSLSDVGCVRAQNEDAWRVDAGRGLLMVADGMGGHSSGEVASKMACDIVQEHLGNQSAFSRTCRIMEEAVLLANKRIYECAQSEAEHEGMGTTLEILWIRRRKAYWAHVGDSRIYLLRDGQMKQLTEDHSLVNEYLKEGLMTKEQARETSLRNVILQAVGSGKELEVQTGSLTFKKDDLFLLCSDGLTDQVTDDAIDTILQENASLEEAARKCIDLAIEKGGPDNITVVLTRVM
jgi:protein phosphatase